MAQGSPILCERDCGTHSTGRDSLRMARRALCRFRDARGRVKPCTCIQRIATLLHCKRSSRLHARVEYPLWRQDLLRMRRREAVKACVLLGSGTSRGCRYSTVVETVVGTALEGLVWVGEGRASFKPYQAIAVDTKPCNMYSLDFKSLASTSSATPAGHMQSSCYHEFGPLVEDVQHPIAELGPIEWEGGRVFTVLKYLPA